MDTWGGVINLQLQCGCNRITRHIFSATRNIANPGEERSCFCALQGSSSRERNFDAESTIIGQTTIGPVLYTIEHLDRNTQIIRSGYSTAFIHHSSRPA